MRSSRLGSVLASSAAVLAVGLVLGGCTGTNSDDGGPGGATGPTTTLPAEESGPPVVFVSVGGDETLGFSMADRLRERWTQLVFRDHLPRRSVHVNVASSGATVASALEVQLPLALEVAPTLVTVWLGGADAAQATRVSSYERDLEDLVRQMQGDGSTQVVVAVGPAVEDDGGSTEPYDAAAERVAGRTGAGLVDLRAVDLGAAADGQRQVAMAVADALNLPG